jgi:hypothetical protein
MLNIAMENTEVTNNKIQVAAKIDPAVFAIVEQLRNDEDRNLSNMIERLLKTHPRVQPMLEAETAGAGA